MSCRFLIAIICAIPSAAAAAGELTSYVLEFGDRRSQLWAILAEQPEGASEFAFAIADQLALNPERAAWPYIAGSAISASPVLRFDRNVNNGFAADRFETPIGTFVVDEDARAVKSVVAGAALSGGIAFGLTQGTTLTVSGRTSYLRALGKPFEVITNTAAISLDYTAQDWTYATAGFGISNEVRALGDEKTRRASWTLGKLFGQAGHHLHDISGTFIRAKEDETWQSRIRVDWTGTFANAGVFGFGIERGEQVEGALLPKMTTNLAYSNIILGQPTTIFASYSQETGGDFFGMSREDRTFVLRLERRINENLSVSLSGHHKNSTIDSFDDSFVDMDFQFTGFRF